MSEIICPNPILIPHPYYHDDGAIMHYRVSQEPGGAYVLSFEGALLGRYSDMSELIGDMLMDAHANADKE